MNERVTEQTAPIPNARPGVWDLVIEDMAARDSEGRRKYGTPLQPDNGRDAIVDAFQESLDLVVYLRQFMEERKAILGDLEDIHAALLNPLFLGPDHASNKVRFETVRRLEDVMRRLRRGGRA